MQPDSKREKLLFLNFTAKDERHYEFRITDLSRWVLAELEFTYHSVPWSLILRKIGSSSHQNQKEEPKRDVSSSGEKDYL